MRLDEFLCNESLKEYIRASLRIDRMSHSYIIEGPHGTGKRTFARILASALMCSANGDRPCGICRDCIKNAKGIHPDLIEIMPEEGKNSISVDRIKDIRKELYILPNESAVKVYIIPNADSMTIQAQNALLKSFEEPPKFAVFILTTSNKNSLLPVIVSRAISLSTSPVTTQELLKIINNNMAQKGKRSSDAVAVMAQGSIGRAIEMMEDPFFEQTIDFCADFAKQLCDRDKNKFFSLSQYIEKNKTKYDIILDMLKMWLRDIMVYKAGSANICFCDHSEEIIKAAAKLTAIQLIHICEDIDKCRDALMQNANVLTSVTLFFADSWEETH